MAVGDVKSAARGSGARYNDGKPDLSLIPLTIVASSFDTNAEESADPAVLESLNLLGLFQTTGNGDYLRDALRSTNMDWRDAARVFEYGKKKYAAWNWAKGMAWSIPLACAARHALAILEGEETDPESGLPHIGHYMANLVMLAHFVRWFPEGNDLPPPELFRDAPPPPYIAPPPYVTVSDVVAAYGGGGVSMSRHSPEGFDAVLEESLRVEAMNFVESVVKPEDVPATHRGEIEDYTWHPVATFPPFKAP
jgi:hypothetical protein